MSAPAGNEWGSIIRNSATLGVALTPGNDTYPTPVEIFGSGTTVAWPSTAETDDAYAFELTVSGIGVSTLSKDAKLNLYYVKAASGVDITDNEFDFALRHGLETADGPVQFTTSGTLPTGVSLATNYWIIKRTAFSYAIATSEANARAGTAVDFTALGSGTHTATCIKIAHLSVSESQAASAVTSGGRSYYFPLHIPSGILVYASISTHNATVGTAAALMQLYTQPSKPWAVRAGTFVRTFGAVPASSAGTAITPVNGSKSAYVDLGATADVMWHWNLGVGFDNAAYPNNNVHFFDLALGETGTERIVIKDAIVLPSNTELIGCTTLRIDGLDTNTVAENVFVRAMVSGVAGTGWSVTGYGLGGRYLSPTTAAVEGTVTVSGVNPSGEDVEIYAVDSDGLAELVTSATTNGSGFFTAEVYDDGRDYFARYAVGGGDPPGCSFNGTPGIDVFDIDISGSGETTDPVVTVISTPAEARDPLVVSVYDNVGLTLYQLTCKDRTDGKRLVIYSSLDGGFVHPFSGKSTVTGSGTVVDPYIFTVYRRGRWPTELALDIVAQAIDTSGNEAHV